MEPSDQEIWVEIDKSRSELADVLESLTPEQWDRQSLCEAWRVRDVAAHVAVPVTRKAIVTGLLRNRLNFNRWQATFAIDNAARPQQELVDRLRARVGQRAKPPLVKNMDVLTDIVVHTQDIRRPLRIPGAPPTHRWIAIADFVKDHRFYGTPKKREGLTLRATDTEWSVGDGPLVQGPIEAIVLAMVGRKTAFNDLSGDGARTMKARL